jgi:hypothetical protein
VEFAALLQEEVEEVEEVVDLIIGPKKHKKNWMPR